MDKIQELHLRVWVEQKQPDDVAKSHATITEDLMGRFAEWCQLVPYAGANGRWLIDEKGKAKEYTTSELINLFKETL